MNRSGRGRGEEVAARQRVLPKVDASGPLLTLCLGQRCSALRRLAGTEASVEGFRSAVRGRPGAVLVVAECLGPCSLAAVAAVSRRDGCSGYSGRTVWLTGIEQPTRADALRHWVLAGGPARLDRPDADLPPSLVEATVGVGLASRRSAAGDQRGGVELSAAAQGNVGDPGDDARPAVRVEPVEKPPQRGAIEQ